MRRGWPALALLVVALLATGCGGGAGDGAAAKPRLVVSAAASLQQAFTQYGKAFAEGDARFSFAGSNVLAAQIRQGARPDVYAAANTTLPDGLYAVDGLLEKPVRFASNELVLARRAGSTKVGSLRDVTKHGVRLAIGTPGVPVGSYTAIMLSRMSRAEREAIQANVRSEEPDVTGIVGKLAQGAVDAGFLYITDVRAANGKLQAIHLPPRVLPIVEYSVGVLKSSRQPEAAKAFVYGLLSGAGRDALEAAGFGSPAAT